MVRPPSPGYCPERSSRSTRRSPWVEGLAGAGRRSPTRRRGVRRARWGASCSRPGAGQPPRSARGAHGRDRRESSVETGRPAQVFRQVSRIPVRRRALVAPGIPLRGRHDDGAGTGARGSRASWVPPGPSGGRDDLDRTKRRSPGTGSFRRGDVARAAAPGGWFASARQPPRFFRPSRVASPPASRRTPGGGTFPMKLPRHQAAFSVSVTS